MMRPGRLFFSFLLALFAAGCQTPSASAPRIALFYSDLDGTLLNEQSQVTEDMKAAVARLQAAGVRVGAATGRTLDTALPLAQSLKVDLPVISANGAVIVSPAGKLIRLLGIENDEDVRAMCRVIENGGCGLVYTAYARRDTGETRIAEGVCQPSDDPDWLVVKLRGRECTGIAFLLNKLPSLVDGRYSVIESGTGKYHGISVAALGVGKEHALRFVAGRLGVPLRQIAFVGDSNNDLEAARLLHREGGLCYAVENGTADLKKVCPRHTTRTNEQGGVIEVIDQLLKLSSR